MRTQMRLGIAVAAFAAVLGTAAMAIDFNPQCYQNTNHEFFVSGFQRYTTLKSGDGVFNKTKYSPTAGAVGYRYSTPQWSGGLVVSYEGGRSKNYMGDDYLRIRDNTLGFTLFGRYNGMNGWYASSSLFTGFNNMKTRGGRIAGVGLSSAGGEDSTYFAASLEVGKLYEFGDGFRMTPHAGIDYAHTPSMDLKYRVRGAGSFSDSMESQNFYEVPIGVTFAKDFVTCDWVITPSVDLTMVSSIGHMKDDSYNFRSGFASYDGSQWRVYGSGAEHWGGRITAGIKAVKSERFDLGVNYSYEGRKDYNDHRITAGIGLKF